MRDALRASCDRGSGRRPKLKKDREAMLHYLHDSTIPPKSHFCPIIHQSPIGPMGLKLRMLKDLAYLNGMPFTALKNSYWFRTYEFFKFAKSSLKFILSDSDSFQRFSPSDF